MTEIGEILNKKQLEAMEKAGFSEKIAIRAASDSQLVAVDGIGAATVVKLREWSIYELPEGDAVAHSCLILKDGDERLQVLPGDIIPARFGAARQVEKGRATWE